MRTLRLCVSAVVLLLAVSVCADTTQRRATGRRSWYVSDKFTNAPAQTFPFAVTSFKYFNLGGPDVTSGNDFFKSSTNTDITFTGSTFITNMITAWLPTPTGNVGTLLQTGARFLNGGSIALLSCPPGTYLFSLGVGDDTFYDQFALTINGAIHTSNFNVGPTGLWAEVGPFQVTLPTTQDVTIATTRSAAIFQYLKSWKRLANTPPNGSISTPTNSQTFTAPATISLTASANDPDGQVVLAEYFNSGTFIGSATVSPWTVNWSGVLAGTYTINARFTDDRGGVTTVSGPSIVVNLPANVAPTVTLSAPANGASYGATFLSDGTTLLSPTVTLSSAPADGDGTISRVDYFAGSQLIGTVTGTPWSYDWRPPLGTFILKAVAVDNVGAQTASSTVTISVTNVVVSTPTNQPPIVSLIAPGNNSTFTAPATVVLTGSATDSDGTIASVKFYSSGSLLGTDTSTPYNWTNTALAAGTYVFSAIAQDDKGTNATSASITVLVVSPTPPVTVNAGQDQTITLPATATLAGTVTGGASPTWSKFSGPGSVTFGNATVTNTTATFGSAGAYVLRLTATSGNTNLYDDVALQVNPATPPAVAQTILLPVEIVGDNGTIQTRTATLTNISTTSTAYSLYLQAHNLPTYFGKGSLKINNGPWVDITDTSVAVREPEKSYGGIFGAFYTCRFDYAIPTNTLIMGDNLLQFRLNYAPTNSQLNTSLSGWCVVDLQINSNGIPLIASTNLVQEDPSTWQPIYANATSYAQGKALWDSASLIDTGNAITAHCGDCHAVDGSDLKYYCYSNPSIIARSRFHGLSQLQGELIASYIRSLPVVAPGRPWNPPYQPGAGLDAGPVTSWSAGAGLSAVLTNDAQMLSYLFPSGISYNAVTNSVNARTTPVIYQFPDWNHWLPTVHPKDAWTPNTFTNDNFFKYYANVVSTAAAAQTAGYTSGSMTTLKTAIDAWNLARYNFLLPRTEGNLVPSPYTPADGQRAYSTGQWWMIKEWEIMHTYGLEGRQVNSQSRETRTWFDSVAFDISPNILKIPDDKTGINNGSVLMKKYFSSVWYQVQLTLNPGNSADGSAHGDIRPVDWPYCYGFITDVQVATGYRAAASPALLFCSYLLKGMQVNDTPSGNGLSPFNGWRPTQAGDVALLVNPSKAFFWTGSGVSGANRTALFENMLLYWLDRSSRFTPAQYYAAGYQSAGYVVPASPSWDGQMALADHVWLMIPNFRTAGVSEGTLTAVKNWAATVWPANNWSSR